MIALGRIGDIVLATPRLRALEAALNLPTRRV
jgi:ADP-heptose:LPS heptosyltransferase